MAARPRRMSPSSAPGQWVSPSRFASRGVQAAFCWWRLVTSTSGQRTISPSSRLKASTIRAIRRLSFIAGGCWGNNLGVGRALHSVRQGGFRGDAGAPGLADRIRGSRRLCSRCAGVRGRRRARIFRNDRTHGPSPPCGRRPGRSDSRPDRALQQADKRLAKMARIPRAIPGCDCPFGNGLHGGIG